MLDDYEPIENRADAIACYKLELEYIARSIDFFRTSIEKAMLVLECLGDYHGPARDSWVQIIGSATYELEKLAECQASRQKHFDDFTQEDKN